MTTSLATAGKCVHAAYPQAPTATAETVGAQVVLVVDDNPALRAYLTRVVGRHYRVETASDGAKALATVQRRPPDLVLSDVMMPVMDGYALCRALKSDPSTRRIPVILVTARHGDEAALAGFDAEADDFVRKPFSALELMARVHTQLRLQRLREHLVRSEKAHLLGSLSSGLAHEVLNPVNALLQSVRLLKDPNLRLTPEERVALLDAVQRGGKRIEGIVRAMQQFARHDTGRLEWRAWRLSACLDEIRPLLAHRLRSDRTLHEAPGDDPEVHCQPDLVQQALTNLVLNGLDAATEVWVSASRDGATVVVRVQDNGPGVPAGERDRIFAPFHTTKPPGKGTGMGLAIARDIAEAHGGTLEVRDSPHGGACFELRLPPRATA